MCLGGLSLINPMSSYAQVHEASTKVTAPLVERVLHQDHSLTGCHVAQQHAKAEVRSTRRANQQTDALKLQRQFPVHMQRCMELAQEIGASSWLPTLPIDSHGFALHKSAFRGALSLRMVGHLRTHRLTAAADASSALSTLCRAQLEGSPPTGQ